MPWSTLDCIVVHWIGCYKMIYLISSVDILTFFFCFIIHWFPRLVCKDPRELGFHTNLLFWSLVRCLVLHLFLTLKAIFTVCNLCLLYWPCVMYCRFLSRNWNLRSVMNNKNNNNNNNNNYNYNNNTSRQKKKGE